MRIAAGRFKGRRLPRPQGARPISGRLQASLFSHLGDRVEGARVLDVCAGVGGLGIEALSRGARHVTLVEWDRAQARALEAFLTEVGAAAEGLILRQDVRRGLPDGTFDLIFVDPPFAFWDAEDGDDLVRRAAGRLAPGGTLAVKLPASRPLQPPAGFLLVKRAKAGSTAYVVCRRELT